MEKKLITSFCFSWLLLFTGMANAQEKIEPIGKIDIWSLPEMQVYPGEYEPNWESLSNYEVPDWFREAKLA